LIRFVCLVESEKELFLMKQDFKLRVKRREICNGDVYEFGLV